MVILTAVQPFSNVLVSNEDWIAAAKTLYLLKPA